jgi:hypothetical protein
MKTGVVERGHKASTLRGRGQLLLHHPHRRRLLLPRPLLPPGEPLPWSRFKGPGNGACPSGRGTDRKIARLGPNGPCAKCRWAAGEIWELPRPLFPARMLVRAPLRVAARACAMTIFAANTAPARTRAGSSFRGAGARASAKRCNARASRRAASAIRTCAPRAGQTFARTTRSSQNCEVV